MHDRLDRSPSRRSVLHAGATLSGLGLAALAGGPAHAAALAARRRDDELLDRGLERIAAGSPATHVHRSNHAPMVIEVLRELGHADRIEAWLDDHLEPLQRRPASTRAIAPDGDDWRTALSVDERYQDWYALFVREIEAHGGSATLRKWVPRLAPGLAGAATHGLIRTGHAARGLDGRDNAVRRNELALGLAYWASTYQELPWDGSKHPQPGVEAAFARLEPRLPALQPPRGNIVAGLSALAATPSFLPVCGLIEPDDPGQTLAQICACFARAYLGHPERRVHFTHAVTAPSALRLLLPHLDEETAHVGVHYAWQASAGLYVVYGEPGRELPASRPLEVAELERRAVERGHAHGIKLAEACLRESRHSDDPLLLAAAADAAIALDV